MNIFWKALIGLILGYLAGTAFVGRRTKRINHRRWLLADIKKNHIPFFMSGNHLAGGEQFMNIEELTKEYRFTEEELGISLNALLGRAVICQREAVIPSIEKLLESFKDQSNKLAQEKRPIGEWAVSMSEIIAPHIQAHSSRLLKAQEIYKILNERWIRSQGQDPASVAQLDIYKPQAS